MPHAEFGDFILQKEICKGGQAVVYLAENRYTSCRYALKIYDQSSAKGRLSFFNEIHAMSASRKCDHIIYYHRSFVAEDKGVLVMDIMTCDLEELTVNWRPSEKEAKHLCYQIAEAVRYLHERNLAHLDIKPSNCLVKSSKVVLSDFGHSLSFELYDSCPKERGTPEYACPESEQSTFHPKAADMWSLGATLYFIITSNTLYNEISDYSEIPSHINSIKNISPVAKDLLKHLLDLDNSKRFDIHQALSHEFFRTKRAKVRFGFKSLCAV